LDDKESFIIVWKLKPTPLDKWESFRIGIWRGCDDDCTGGAGRDTKGLWFAKSSKTVIRGFWPNVFKEGGVGWTFCCSRVIIDGGLVSIAKIRQLVIYQLKLKWRFLQWCDDVAGEYERIFVLDGIGLTFANPRWISFCCCR
jgi:hypothetical protein